MRQPSRTHAPGEVGVLKAFASTRRRAIRPMILPYVDPRHQQSRDSAFLLCCDA